MSYASLHPLRFPKRPHVPVRSAGARPAPQGSGRKSSFPENFPYGNTNDIKVKRPARRLPLLFGGMGSFLANDTYGNSTDRRSPRPVPSASALAPLAPFAFTHDFSSLIPLKPGGTPLNHLVIAARGRAAEDGNRFLDAGGRKSSRFRTSFPNRDPGFEGGPKARINLVPSPKGWVQDVKLSSRAERKNNPANCFLPRRDRDRSESTFENFREPI